MRSKLKKNVLWIIIIAEVMLAILASYFYFKPRSDSYHMRSRTEQEKLECAHKCMNRHRACDCSGIILDPQ